MSDVAFAELTKTVTALPYEEQIALIDVLKKSVDEKYNQKDPRIDAVNDIFGIISHEEAQEIRDNRLVFRENA